MGGLTKTSICLFKILKFIHVLSRNINKLLIQPAFGRDLILLFCQRESMAKMEHEINIFEDDKRETTLATSAA